MWLLQCVSGFSDARYHAVFLRIGSHSFHAVALRIFGEPVGKLLSCPRLRAVENYDVLSLSANRQKDVYILHMEGQNRHFKLLHIFRLVAKQKRNIYMCLNVAMITKASSTTVMVSKPFVAKPQDSKPDSLFIVLAWEQRTTGVPAGVLKSEATLLAKQKYEITHSFLHFLDKTRLSGGGCSGKERSFESGCQNI